MASDRTAAGEVAAKYVAENPDMPSKTLAKKLRHDEPKLFVSVDRAYGMVRFYRGNKGEEHRRVLRDKSLMRPNGKAGTITLPKGRDTFTRPLKIKGPLKVLVLSDSHVPYHDETVLEAAIRHGVDAGCDGVYFNGDTIDCYALSRWQKDPRERDFKRECDMTREVLTEFAKYFERRWYKFGNHDERYEICLSENMPDLLDFEEFELRSILKLKETGYEYIESKQWAELGKMPLLHGHEFGKGLTAPVNPARGLWNRTASTGMIGHLHRPSSHTEKMSIEGNVVACWSLGCTCNLRPNYAVLNKWTHGWAVVTIAGNGTYNVENYMFIDGEAFRA